MNYLFILLRSITRLADHAAPCRRGSRGLVTGHSGEKTCVRKANRASQLNDVNSARTRERHRSEMYLMQSIKKCTTKRGMWQLGERGGSERVIRCPCVTNTKTSQDYLSVSSPVCGGTPSVDGGLNQDQVISGSPASIP